MTIAPFVKSVNWEGTKPSLVALFVLTALLENSQTPQEDTVFAAIVQMVGTNLNPTQLCAFNHKKIV